MISIFVFTHRAVLRLRHMDGSLRLRSVQIARYQAQYRIQKTFSFGRFYDVTVRSYCERMFRESSREKFSSRRKICLFVLLIVIIKFQRSASLLRKFWNERNCFV